MASITSKSSRLNEERAFLRAEISLVQDEDQDEDEVEDNNDPASRPGQPAGVEQAVRLHAEIVKLAGADLSEPDETAPPIFLSCLAGSLPLDLDFKQNLLATLSETKRLEAVVGYLQAVLPGLRRAAKARWN